MAEREGEGERKEEMESKKEHGVEKVEVWRGKEGMMREEKVEVGGIGNRRNKGSRRNRKRKKIKEEHGEAKIKKVAS